MKWRAARIGDRVYDLSHLHPFSFDFVVAAKGGKPEQRYGIDVIFSLHCFSRGIPAGAAYLADLAYADSREVRLFDEQRYTHSLRLPEVIRSIGDRRCFHTGHDNFFTVELIGARDERVEYTVYFKLSRAPSKGRLNLYVQSAYVQDDIPQTRPKRRKPIRFSVIAYNVAVGKAIKVPE
jgi:hypothetical protein